MKNKVLGLEDAVTVQYVNTSTTTVTVSGSVVQLAGQFGVLITDAAINNGVAEALVRGRVRLPKATGVSFTVDQPLGWDAANNRVTATLDGGAVIRVTAPAASADTVVEGDLNPAPRRATINRVATAGEATANTGTWVVGFTPQVWDIQIRTTTGGNNTAGYTRTISSGTVTFAATDIATTDVLVGYAFEF